MGINVNDLIPIGKYAGGHPEIDKIIESCNIYLKNGALHICEYDTRQLLSTKSTIKVSAITDIQVEDASTLDKKVTLGRVLLVGVFALAWRKNKKDEHAFVCVDWNDGKFDHSTIFAFEGKNSMQSANTARNALIKISR